VAEILDQSELVAKLPAHIGGAVIAHYFFQKVEDRKLPNPDEPADVEYVVSTVLNYTGSQREEIQHHLPGIQALMRELTPPVTE
jgi:hypothetical protein